MRGEDRESGALFSYVDMEARIPANHPLRAMRRLTNAALAELDASFSALYEGIGRPSIPPERLLRASLERADCAPQGFAYSWGGPCPRRLMPETSAGIAWAMPTLHGTDRLLKNIHKTSC